MRKKLNIEDSNFFVFRTDEIHVTPMMDERMKSPAGTLPKEKLRCSSPDGKWTVKTSANWLYIVDQEKQAVDYKVQFSASISRAFFFHAGDYLAVIIRGADPGVFLFCLKNGHWRFANELESSPNQSLLNSRLRHVFLTDQDLGFVYNNRIRKYSLSDGALINNQALRNARSYSYAGEDIRTKFLLKS